MSASLRYRKVRGLGPSLYRAGGYNIVSSRPRVPRPPPPPFKRIRRYGAMRRNKMLYRTKPGGDTLTYPGIGIPSEFNTKLNYIQDLTMTASVGNSYRIQQFLGNSLYDPDYTGTGLQPEYFDQICGANALYKRYVVTASKISIRCCSTSDAFSGGNSDIAVTFSDQPYASVGWTSIDDQISDKATHKTSVVRYDNQGAKYIKHYAKTDNVLDIKDIKDNLTACGAYYNASPSQPWYWIIGQQGMDRTSTTSSVNYLVKITYYVTFYTENMPTLS